VKKMCSIAAVQKNSPGLIAICVGDGSCLYKWWGRGWQYGGIKYGRPPLARAANMKEKNTLEFDTVHILIALSEGIMQPKFQAVYVQCSVVRKLHELSILRDAI
jgi:hypothetical protein